MFTWKPDSTPDFGQPSGESTALPVPSGEYSIEAEHASPTNATISNQPGASGGRVVGNIRRANSAVLFDYINVPAAGSYVVSVRYATTGRCNATQSVEVNGHKAGSLLYPSTRGRGYGTATFQATLQRGYQNAIRFSRGSGRVELDKVELSWRGE
jgi:hypothetical protein